MKKRGAEASLALRWIERPAAGFTETITKFLPLPKGEEVGNTHAPVGRSPVKWCLKFIRPISFQAFRLRHHFRQIALIFALRDFRGQRLQLFQ